MSVRDALDEELEAMPATIRESALAEGARALADSMDASLSLRDLAAAQKELRATMETLEARANQAPSEEDPIEQSQDRGPAPIPINSRRSG